MKQNFIYKMIFGFSILFCLLTTDANICLAGDVPEALLYDKEASVYFGEVEEVQADKLVINVTENIKGFNEIGTKLTYNNWAFTPDPEVGMIYLCGYLNEDNPLYIWTISGTDLETLSIANEDNMSKRMEKLINDGDFTIAQEKLIEEEKLTEQENQSEQQDSSEQQIPSEQQNQQEQQKLSEQQNSSEQQNLSEQQEMIQDKEQSYSDAIAIIGGADGPTTIFISAKHNSISLVTVGIFGIVILFGIIIFIKKRKS